MRFCRLVKFYICLSHMYDVTICWKSQFYHHFEDSKLFCLGLLVPVISTRFLTNEMIDFTCPSYIICIGIGRALVSVYVRFYSWGEYSYPSSSPLYLLPPPSRHLNTENYPLVAISKLCVERFELGSWNWMLNLLWYNYCKKKLFKEFKL